MSLLGIGTDLVKISRIEKLWYQYGKKFSTKILSQKETALLKLNRKPVLFLAKRFAAKEAIVKALGTGFRFGILFEDITLDKNELGKPKIVLSAKAEKVAKKLKVKKIHISLSDELDYVIAFVVLAG